MYMHYSFQVFIHMNLSEQFHVTNGVIQGGYRVHTCLLYI